uniref:Hexosyltransferase n=1 Tax=Panagrolaimus sp. ES5 TaxID=591445 RepID=A0AC34GCH2_9BILA
MYDGIYAPIQNYYMEWDDDISDESDKIDKFQIQLKDLNVSYYFLRDEMLECNETKLLIVIPSRPNAYHTRMAIRNSWLKNLVGFEKSAKKGHSLL